MGRGSLEFYIHIHTPAVQEVETGAKCVIAFLPLELGHSVIMNRNKIPGVKKIDYPLVSADHYAGIGYLADVVGT